MSSNASVKELEALKNALDQHSIVAITDVAGRITYVNEKFCAISQYSREELMGQDHRILNSGYHPKEFMRELWRTIAAGKVWKGEVRNKAKDGSFYWVDVTIVPFMNEEGKPYQYVAIRTDITARKAQETELQKKNEELKHLNERKDDFINSVSHELRTPLTIIHGSISLMADGLLGEINEKQRKYLTKTIENVDRLTLLINELLDISIIEKGKLKLNKRNVDLVALVEEVVANFIPQAEKKGWL